MKLKKIFVADDWEGKRDNIVGTMRHMFGEVEIQEFSCAADIVCALQECEQDIQDSPWDYLVVIDMQMPNRVGEASSPKGGYNVLIKMQTMALQCPAIVVSSELISDNTAKGYYNDFAGSVIWTSYTDQQSQYWRLLASYYRDKMEEED